MNRTIYIHLGKSVDELPVGASHWFGYPDLPADVEVPYVDEKDGKYALTLICQINLSDLPETGIFPRRGLLQFYADVAYYRGDWDEPAISMHVSDNRVCRVLFTPEEKLPELENTQPRFFEQDEAQAIPIVFNYSQPTLEEPELQLLGSTDRLEWETWPDPCAGWQLLLMMDSMEGSDYNYNFVDCGALCFIIDPAYLRRLDFSNVKAIILST